MTNLAEKNSLTMTKTPRRADDKPVNKRGAARLCAVQAVYQMELSGASLASIIAEYEETRLGGVIDGEQYLAADSAYFRNLVAGVVSQQKVIDPLINGALTPSWPLNRVDITLRAILRCGAFELQKRKDVPARVVINEYINVAKAFFEVDEPRIVNGVLDTLARHFRATEIDDKKSC